MVLLILALKIILVIQTIHFSETTSRPNRLKMQCLLVAHTYHVLALCTSKRECIFQDVSTLGMFVANWRMIRERGREEWEGWKKRRKEKKSQKE